MQLSFGFNFWGGGGHRRNNQKLFSKFCSAKNLFLAWDKFCRGKREKQDAMLFERDLEMNLFELQSALQQGSYRHGKYEAFTISDPKQRRIHKATVRDRVVHQALVNSIEPFFEKQFIFDSYSCRVDKGTHAAVKRLGLFLRQASRNNRQSIYALKCDVRRFFDSVDHQILFSLLQKRVQDSAIQDLIKHILKSFSVTENKGLPLGNLSSQLFANVYLHELDRFVKHNLKQKYYLRYCDDFLILSQDRQELFSLIPVLAAFLEHRLKLHLHPNKVSIRSWTQGIDFVGYVLMPHCTVLRTKTKKRMLKRVNEINMPSYLGLCQHADAYESEELIRTIIPPAFTTK